MATTSWDDPQDQVRHRLATPGCNSSWRSAGCTAARTPVFSSASMVAGLRHGGNRICQCKTESGQGVGKGRDSRETLLGWWMFLVVTVDGHVWPCGSRGLMPERRPTVRRPAAQVAHREVDRRLWRGHPECGFRTGWASALLMLARTSDNTHRQTLRRGTRWPVRKRYQFLPTRNSGGWAFRLLRDLCQPSTLRGHNATPHVQAWFARLRELAEGAVKIVRLDILQRGAR